MTSGKQVYGEIQDVIQEVESQSNKIGKQIQSIQTGTKDLAQQQEDTYVQLALVYLPEMEAKAVKQTIAEVRGDVQRIFDRKNERRLQLEELLSDTSAQRTKLQSKLKVVSTDFEKTTDEKEKIESAIKNDLAQNSSYVDVDKKYQFALERLKQDKRRAEAFEEEAKAKLSAYESNNLFMYLIQRKVNTPEQEGNNLTRILDDFVARVVNFEENKKSYAFLKAMPEKMEAEIEEEKTEVDALITKMQIIRDEAVQRYKLPPVLEECRTIEKTRNDLRRAIELADNELIKYQTEITQNDEKKGTYHLEAIKKLKGYLSGETLTKLKELARSTPSQEDDNLVERIESISDQFEKEKDRITDLKKQQSEIQRKLEELRGIERNFDSNDYDSSRSTFSSGFDVNSLLTGFILGKYSASHVNSEIGNNHHLKPVETYHSSSSDWSSSSSSWGGSSSSHSGGGFSSGGGFGGGGSRTGGGF